MITKYGQVIIQKDENCEDQVIITGFTWDASKDEVGETQNLLRAASLRWAYEVINRGYAKHPGIGINEH